MRAVFKSDILHKINELYEAVARLENGENTSLIGELLHILARIESDVEVASESDAWECYFNAILDIEKDKVCSDIINMTGVKLYIER